MLVYWLLFTLPLLAMLSSADAGQRLQLMLWAVVGLVFSMVIGLRHQVGGDWFNYLDSFDYVSTLTLDEAVSAGDPGYFVLNWLVSQGGGSIYLVNLASAVIVVVGVSVFARKQPNPWLALLVAVPYLIVVVAMGYTRQSVALGFAMIGLAALGKQGTVKFVIWVLLGALFHKTAVLLLPIAALAASRRRLWTWTWVAVTTAVGGALLLLDSSQELWTNYVEAGMYSDGGVIRVAMNAVPAVLLLVLRGRLELEPGERRLWPWIAIFSLLCVPLVSVSSTAVDRVALYFIPLQMFVFARLPRLTRHRAEASVVIGSTVVYYGVVLWVWLNLGNHAQYWAPYRFMPL